MFCAAEASTRGRKTGCRNRYATPCFKSAVLRVFPPDFSAVISGRKLPRKPTRMMKKAAAHSAAGTPKVQAAPMAKRRPDAGAPKKLLVTCWALRDRKSVV